MDRLHDIVGQVISTRSGLRVLTESELMQAAARMRGIRPPWADHDISRALAVTAEAIERQNGYGYDQGRVFAGAAMSLGFTANLPHVDNKDLWLYPAFVYAAQGYPVHVIAANENGTGGVAFSRRVLGLLGTSVTKLGGSTLVGERSEAYKDDVVCGDVSTFAFDYLRNGLAFEATDFLFQVNNSVAIACTLDVFAKDARAVHFIDTPRTGVPEVEEFSKLRVGVHYEIIDQQILFTQRGFKWLDKKFRRRDLFDVTSKGFIGKQEVVLARRHGLDIGSEVLARVNTAGFLKSYGQLVGLVAEPRMNSLVREVFGVHTPDEGTSPPESVSSQDEEIKRRVVRGLSFDDAVEQKRVAHLALRESMFDQARVAEIMISYLWRSSLEWLPQREDEREKLYQEKHGRLDAESSYLLRRRVLLEAVDLSWREYLVELDMAYKYINFACREPSLDCYKDLAESHYSNALKRVAERAIEYYFKIQLP